MARIDELLADADLIIEKQASKKQEAPKFSDTSDDAVKIANLLISEDEALARGLKQEKIASAEKPEDDILVKVASGLVLAEVMCNMDKFNRIAEFEKKAQDAGHSQVEIDQFIVEKFL